jgi:hypothetical protein
VTETLQLEEIKIIYRHDAPKLLVEWSSRWEDFVTSVRPALGRSGPPLAGEAPFGIFPYRGLLASFLLELFLLFVVLILPRQIDRLRPYAPPKVRPYDVIYYSADELPHTDDLGGAESGASGHAGGDQAHHRTQTIRVARGTSLAPQVVDAPSLKLPSSTAAVANLLAFKSDPGPPPSEGLHSSLTAPRLSENVIAPAPVNVPRDQSRGAVFLDSIVPPAPAVAAAKSRSIPVINSAVVPPAPSVRSEHTLIAPSLTARVIAPAPNVARESTRSTPSMNANVIGPASTQLSRDQSRSTPALQTSVIQPAPASVAREVAPSRVQMNNVAVVPPPVSAPERESARAAKLRLPAPSVVAPPPSAAAERSLRRLESGSAGISSTIVVPPPPTAAASGSFVSSIVGKLFGTQDVVPPPPTVSSGSRGNSSGALTANIVPPPPSASGIAASPASGGSSRRTALGASIVPPPPSVTDSAADSGTTRHTSLSASVVPPPPSVTGSGSSGAAGNRGSGIGPLASNIIPPPPSVSAGSAPSGSGRKGVGLGGLSDAGSVLAPPKSPGGSRENSGVVVSAQPGSNMGVPDTSHKGSLALSPSGGDKPGLGGSGGGQGLVHGQGPGSSLTGENSGAGKSGAGHAADLNSRGGISPTPGPGGAGSAPTGSPAVPGVDVRGGSTIVTLPSFGSDSSADPNNLPGRSPVNAQQGPSITIVATSRSGGAFDFYGKLPGDNYTVYVDTAIGTVVMQFAEADPAAAHAHAGTLVGPQGLRTDLPVDLPHARVVIKCKLDASGNLRNLQVLEPGPAAMTAKIIAALPSWKFRPAMRGAQPVEVNAILGFNIDTNDRN